MSNKQNIVSTRFIECLNTLKEKGQVRSYRQFALNTSIHPQSLNEILKGKRNVTIEMARSATEVFLFNPIYLYTGQGDFFLDESGALPGKNKIVTVVTNNEAEEKITYVPVAAQAGYGDAIDSPTYFQELETFSLPGQRFMSRTKRCFDIEGDSMEPSISHNDKVVAAFVEQETWLNNIRSSYVYVIVTKESIFLKRVENLIKEEQQIVLHSDNQSYPPLSLQIEEVEEVWIVETVISPFNQRSSVIPSQIESLEHTVIEQKALIEALQDELIEMKKSSVLV